MRHRHIFPIVAIAALALAPVLARAADPANATISPANPKVTWTGGPLPLPARGATVQDVNRDDFTLTISVPDSYYATHRLAAVRITATFGSGDDLDITVSGEGNWSRSTTLRGGDKDQVTLVRPASGEYRVSMRPFKPLAGTYEATAELVDLPRAMAAPFATTAGTLAFQANTLVDPPYIDGNGDKQASDNTGEPNVAVDGAGRIFVTAPGFGVLVWRSENGGTSFTKMGDFDEDFLLGGGDADIEIDRHDNVYIADLAVVSINVLKSTDHGATFPQRAVTGYEADRQWLATYGDDVVYLGYHDFVAEEEIVYRSADGGATFTQITPVETTLAPQDHLDCAENTFSGTVAVDQSDETIYIVYACSNVQSNLTGRTPPYGPANQLYVGVSTDQGRTFTNHKVVSYPAGSNLANLFPQMTLDRAGNAYVAWSVASEEGGASDVHVTYSRDKGETWHAPIKVTKTPGTRMFPWVAAGDAGRIAIVYATTPATSSDDLDAVWNVNLSQSLNLLSSSPAFTEVQVSDHPIHTGQVCASGILCSIGGDRSLLDFIEVGLDPKGYANVVWTENAGGARHLGFSRQVSGPSLFEPAVLGKTTKKPAAKPKPGALAATGADEPWPIAVVMLAGALALGARVRRRSPA